MTNRTEVSFEEFPVTGSMTGTFLGAQPADISFVGSASWADTTKTASIAVSAETSSITLGGVESASFAATASIVLGGIESATFAISASFADNSILAQKATSSISASFGKITGSFLGDAEASVSFKGSASFALNASSASFATGSNIIAATASFASGAGVISQTAEAAPLAIPFFGGLDGIIRIEDLGATPIEIPAELTARTRVDLTGFTQARLSVFVSDADGSTTGTIAVQYSLDESSFAFLNGFDGPKAFFTASGTNADPSFTTIVSESRTDVVLRLVATDPGANKPDVGMIVLYLRGTT